MFLRGGGRINQGQGVEVQKELREELIEEGAKLANTNGPLCRGT